MCGCANGRARQVNKITQYEPNTMSDAEAAKLMADHKLERFLTSIVDTTRHKRPGDITDKLYAAAARRKCLFAMIERLLIEWL
jgi:hypothetical protein